MATLTISALALGMDAGRIRVHIRLADGDYNTVAGTYGSGSIVERITEYTASDGTLSVDLVPNASITPANTYYVVWVGQERFLIEKSAATQTLSAALVADPNILESVLATTRLSDVSDTAATTSGQALLWDGSEWAPVDDLDLPAPTRSGGSATGGLVRPSGLHVLWDYTHGTPVADATIGTAFNAEWYMTIGADGAPFGPAITSGWFGPRGVFNLEGVHRWSTNGNVFSFTPIGFIDVMTHANTSGQARTIHPGWGYVNAQIFTADAATVTLGGNDTAEGGAGFVDTQVFWSVDNGTMDGSTNDYELISFLAGGAVAGNSHLHRRIGFRVAEAGVGHKTNAFLEREWDGVLRVPSSDFEFNDPNGTLIGDVDSDVDSDLDENIGLYIVRLKTGTKNVGIWNRSTTVEAPLAVTIDAAGDTITETLAAGDRLTATTVHLANTTGSSITLTSTPTIPDGTDGQRLSLINVGADPVVLQAESVLTGSGIATGRTLSSGASVTLSWVESLGLWVELDRPGDALALTGDGGALATFWVAGEAVQRVTVGSAPFFGLHGMFAGDGTTNDTYLSRVSAGIWTLGTGGLTGVGKGVTFSEQTDPAAPAANGATLYARDNGAGKTELCVRFATGAVQVIATQP